MSEVKEIKTEKKSTEKKTEYEQMRVSALEQLVQERGNDCFIISLCICLAIFILSI